MSIFNFKKKKEEVKPKVKTGLIPADKAKEILNKANSLEKLTKKDIELINDRIKNHAKTGSNKFSLFYDTTECPLEVAIFELEKAGYKATFCERYTDFTF
ncbi:hypothetical protein [Liquorilactobacillus mali]|uniref:Uncharacterized protein n=1 Tax=Liquorilactobacillus mali KCTC 3596 = DSM 20444 TaxID=1046596 RepID=A0A0R2E9F0_9LACO|nr:hypothetical protein [Liquorilactobacillus mali]KRN09367.1 hypothetical protein FD00_GL001090 [Liquorilactobacillus mali KCTC 3596 = DSM 20444]